MTGPFRQIKKKIKLNKKRKISRKNQEHFLFVSSISDGNKKIMFFYL